MQREALELRLRPGPGERGDEAALRDRSGRDRRFRPSSTCWRATGGTGRSFTIAALSHERRLSSRGDQHSDLKGGHARNALATDLPIAGLLKDLKARGLLGETLVIWGGEFGRTPAAEGTDGRDHHPYGFTLWLAGGGVRGGITYGSTDELGWDAIEDRVHIHDLHATILHLLGLNHEKLTYSHAGRDYRLMRRALEMWSRACSPESNHVEARHRNHLVFQKGQTVLHFKPTAAIALFLGPSRGPAATARAADPWLVFEGADGPGKGKQIVLISGDEEYRSRGSGTAATGQDPCPTSRLQMYGALRDCE